MNLLLERLDYGQANAMDDIDVTCGAGEVCVKKNANGESDDCVNRRAEQATLGWQPFAGAQPILQSTNLQIDFCSYRCLVAGAKATQRRRGDRRAVQATNRRQTASTSGGKNAARSTHLMTEVHSDRTVRLPQRLCR